MIGVISRENEVEAVREFFQLFKTPWEFYTDGKSYEVVISTCNRTPEVGAKLLIIYGSEEKDDDPIRGITGHLRRRNVCLQYDGMDVPIYRNVLSFERTGRTLLSIKDSMDVSGLEIHGSQGLILRIGYDLFQEVAFLLSKGQPIRNAHIPTLEIHIMMLRNWIVNSGIPLIEIPATPAGYDFITCLTHDVDFAKIRHHRFDHTMWGFLYRATVGSLLRLLRHRISLIDLLRNWKAVFSLPFVYLGVARDFWLQFDRYLEIECNLPSTFFLIPFKDRSGDKLAKRFPKRRSAKYDIADVREWAEILLKQGYEIAVHGIDAWHNSEKGRQELERISEITGESKLGIRMHWLCFDRYSPQMLEKAGFCYDSTFGYNETVGYRSGTTQIFRPIGTQHLLELAMHIQDLALFERGRLGLTEEEAWRLCNTMIKNASTYGGVLTVLWHHRSLAPERLWDDFYIKLLDELKANRTWFGTARQVTEWFHRRRNILFKAVVFTENTLQLTLECEDNKQSPDLAFRIHRPGPRKSAPSREKPGYIDIPWNGQNQMEISLL